MKESESEEGEREEGKERRKRGRKKKGRREEREQEEGVGRQQKNTWLFDNMKMLMLKKSEWEKGEVGRRRKDKRVREIEGEMVIVCSVEKNSGYLNVIFFFYLILLFFLVLSLPPFSFFLFIFFLFLFTYHIFR